jgi:Fe-S-cluster containining protein
MQKSLELQQIVPSKTCLSCDVCCRFLDQDSFLAPIFTDSEVQHAIINDADKSLFQPSEDGHSARIELQSYGEIYICPFFEPNSSECRIYISRPLDCQIYPFALMYNKDETEIVLGVDTICPFAETEFETESFQQYIDYIVAYVESDLTVKVITENWALIGPYQETVMTVAVLRKLSRALEQRKS